MIAIISSIVVVQREAAKKVGHSPTTCRGSAKSAVLVGHLYGS
jgi:hypothetical protein